MGGVINTFFHQKKFTFLSNLHFFICFIEVLSTSIKQNSLLPFHLNSFICQNLHQTFSSHFYATLSQLLQQKSKGLESAEISFIVINIKREFMISIASLIQCICINFTVCGYSLWTDIRVADQLLELCQVAPNVLQLFYCRSVSALNVTSLLLPADAYSNVNRDVRIRKFCPVIIVYKFIIVFKNTNFEFELIVCHCAYVQWNERILW